MEQDAAGISARYELSKADFNITLHEKSNQIGGLARTMEFSDAKFDVGPHRFFTYNKEVENLYLKILDKDAIEVKRLTRIFITINYLNIRFPLWNNHKNWVYRSNKNLSKLCIFTVSKVSFKKKPKNFEEWVQLNFGNDLYSKFFKSYTEKVWGVNCKDISTDWGRTKN